MEIYFFRCSHFETKTEIGCLDGTDSFTTSENILSSSAAKYGNFDKGLMDDQSNTRPKNSFYYCNDYCGHKYRYVGINKAENDDCYCHNFYYQFDALKVFSTDDIPLFSDIIEEKYKLSGSVLPSNSLEHECTNAVHVFKSLHKFYMPQSLQHAQSSALHTTQWNPIQVLVANGFAENNIFPTVPKFGIQFGAYFNYLVFSRSSMNATAGLAIYQANQGAYINYVAFHPNTSVNTKKRTIEHSLSVSTNYDKYSFTLDEEGYHSEIPMWKLYRPQYMLHRALRPNGYGCFQDSKFSWFATPSSVQDIPNKESEYGKRVGGPNIYKWLKESVMTGQMSIEDWCEKSCYIDFSKKYIYYGLSPINENAPSDWYTNVFSLRCGCSKSLFDARSLPLHQCTDRGNIHPSEKNYVSVYKIDKEKFAAQEEETETAPQASTVSLSSQQNPSILQIMCSSSFEIPPTGDQYEKACNWTMPCVKGNGNTAILQHLSDFATYVTQSANSARFKKLTQNINIKYDWILHDTEYFKDTVNMSQENASDYLLTVPQPVELLSKLWMIVGNKGSMTRPFAQSLLKFITDAENNHYIAETELLHEWKQFEKFRYCLQTQDTKGRGPVFPSDAEGYMFDDIVIKPTEFNFLRTQSLAIFRKHIYPADICVTNPESIASHTACFVIHFLHIWKLKNVEVSTINPLVFLDPYIIRDILFANECQNQDCYMSQGFANEVSLQMTNDIQHTPDSVFEPWYFAIQAKQSVITDIIAKFNSNQYCQLLTKAYKKCYGYHHVLPVATS